MNRAIRFLVSIALSSFLIGCNFILKEYFDEAKQRQELYRQRQQNYQQRHIIESYPDGSIKKIKEIVNPQTNYFTIKGYYETGELEFLGSYIDTMPVGSFNYYYPNGTVKIFENYENGLLHGEVIHYYPNEIESLVANYSYGKQIGVIQFDEEGRVTKLDNLPDIRLIIDNEFQCLRRNQDVNVSFLTDYITEDQIEIRVPGVSCVRMGNKLKINPKDAEFVDFAFYFKNGNGKLSKICKKQLRVYN